jgi:endonuclease/exonuclease/phosphatase family metal-dependent hydrolase
MKVAQSESKLAGASVYFQHSIPEMQEHQVLMRLLSYNIHKGIGGRDRLYRLARIIAVIENENPDLICLQEVTHGCRRCGGDDQPQVLADYFRCQGILFQSNVNLRTGCYGNLLLSRWPIRDKHQISLRLLTKKPRGAQIAMIDTPEGPLKLVNLHLGLAEKERHWQINHLLTHKLFRDPDGLPELVTGDCNDWRNTLPSGPMAADGFHHVTGPPSRFRSFPAYLPLGSLDKAFCRGGVEIREARIAVSPMAKRASDHLPLVVDFHLAGSRNGD